MAPSTPLRPLALFLVPAALAALWQARALATGLEPLRALALGLCLALAFWILRARGQRPRGLGARLLLAAGVALSFWLSVLEYRVGRATPMALELLALATAALVHATVLLAVTRPPPGDPGDPLAPGDSGAGRLLLRLGLSACALAVTLTGVEAVLRAVTPLNLYSPVPDDPQAGGALIPDEVGRVIAVPGFRGQFVHPQFRGVRVEINDWGLRDGLDEARPPEPGSVSILTLGDSFLFGTGVALEDMFAEQLEARSREFTPRPVRIYNGGIPGYGAIHMRLRLRELAARSQPQVVIAAIFEDNDFQDNWGARELWDEPPDATELEAVRAESEASRQLADARRRDERTLGFFLRTAGGFPYWGATSALVQVTQIDVVLLNLGLIDPVAYTNLFLNICLQRDPPPLVERLRAATLDQLELLREECRALDAEVIVLLIPSVVQADPARYESFLELQEEGAGQTFDRTAFHNDLVQQLVLRGFTVADTLPQLESEIVAGRACYHREGHWNAAGNLGATEALIPVLAELLGED